MIDMYNIIKIYGIDARNTRKALMIKHAL